MQQQYYSDEEGPLGDDNYSQVGGEGRTWITRRPHAAQQQQFPQGFRFPPRQRGLRHTLSST